MLISIYKGMLKILLITLLRWKVLPELASMLRAPIPVSWIIHTIHDSKILCQWKLKPQKLPVLVTELNQSEKTDSISRAHDEFCQSNVLERALEKAIIIRDCKCLPKTWCWKMYWTCCTSDSNSVWAKLTNRCALNFQGALYWFPTLMGVHCENSKGIQSSLNTLMWQ